MRFSIIGRSVQVEIQPIIFSTLILGWSIYYFFSTILEPGVGPKSVLFIKPLAIILGVCYFFVIWSCVKIVPHTGTSGAEIFSDKTVANEHRRLFFVISLAAYAAGITYLGYLIPSVLFMFGVCFYLGVRSRWVLIGLTIGFSTFLTLIFKFVLGVPLPVWPSWELLL